MEGCEEQGSEDPTVHSRHYPETAVVGGSLAFFLFFKLLCLIFGSKGMCFLLKNAMYRLQL